MQLNTHRHNHRHTQTHTHRKTHVCKNHTHNNTYTQANIKICTWMHGCAHRHNHTNTHRHTHTHSQRHTHTRMDQRHTQTYPQTHARTQKHTHRNTHTHNTTTHATESRFRFNWMWLLWLMKWIDIDWAVWRSFLLNYVFLLFERTTSWRVKQQVTPRYYIESPLSGIGLIEMRQHWLYPGKEIHVQNIAPLTDERLTRSPEWCGKLIVYRICIHLCV